VKVLFIPWSVPPHYYPMVPLAWATRLAGHEVQVAGLPTVVGAIERSGMTALPVGESYDPMAAAEKNLPEAIALFTKRAFAAELPPEERTALADRIDELMGEPYVRSAEAMAEDLVPFARAWRPDLVISDPLVLAAPVVAQALGVPLVHHMDGTVVTKEFGFPGRRLYHGPWAKDLARLAERFGVNVGEGRAVRNVDPCPDVLQTPGVPDRLPIRYVPYNGSGLAPKWLAERTERPRVCVTRGLTTSQLLESAKTLIPEIFKSLAELDAEFVVTVKRGDGGILEDIPGKVHMVEEVPLSLLLPTCDVIVHQGGTGTMLTAATLGVPQVMMPKIPGQVACAENLVATGAGFSFHLDSVEPDELRDAVATAISDAGVRDAARALQEKVITQQSPPAEVVGMLERLA
jgi:UDP:flavonoid glycosyltransferase YjiC (YdhE family)